MDLTKTYVAQEVSNRVTTDRDPFFGNFSDHPPAAIPAILQVMRFDLDIILGVDWLTGASQ